MVFNFISSCIGKAIMIRPWNKTMEEDLKISSRNDEVIWLFSRDCTINECQGSLLYIEGDPNLFLDGDKNTNEK